MKVAPALLCLAILASPCGLAKADVDDTLFTSKLWGVRVEAPRNWQLSEQTSYPNILLWMSRRNPDGKILLTAEKLDRAKRPRDYAKSTRKVLQSIGFKVRAPQLHAATGAFWVDLDDGKSYLRQAYLVKDDLGFTLTLSAPSSRLRNQHLRAFDSCLRSLTFIAREEEPAQGQTGAVEDATKPSGSKE